MPIYSNAGAELRHRIHRPNLTGITIAFFKVRGRKMLHCVHFRHNKVYFLFDNKDFRHRYVLIGYCPKCKKTIAELHEERKADGKLFIEQKSGVEAISYLARIVTNIDYSTEKKKEKNIPIGWKFGINIETKKGIKQYSCDFRGKRELVKVIP